MRKYFGVIALALAFVMTLPAQAKFGFGVKAGLNVSKVKFDKSLVESDNRAGFFIGPTAELTIPLLGLGVDASLLYNNRSIKAVMPIYGTENETPVEFESDTEHLHYLDIPINLKYTLGLGSMAAVYAATGPQFSFNVGDGKLFKNSYKLNKSDFSWNVGAGVKLFKHLQVGYNYNIAIGKTAELKDDGVAGTVWNVIGGKDFKTNTHQISIAYMF